MQDANLIQRLQFAESDLLTSLLDGTQMLASYHQSWSTLPGALLGALQNGNVGPDTLSLAHLVAARVSKIATCFLDIKRDEELSTTQLQRDCDAMLHQMAHLSIDTPAHAEKASGATHSAGCSDPPVSSAESPSPHLSACRWLLDNLHNPYPTAEVKNRIAIASSCQVSSVNSWFVNARRRIGWTTLCREHFANCRTDMIDAAYRAFVEEDSQRILSPELRHSFVAMKVAAEGFYSSISTRSVFAGDVYLTLQDAEVHNETIGTGQCQVVKQANIRKVVQDSYPSPDQSTAESPLLAFEDSFTDENEENVVPPTLTGSKRRRSFIGPVNQPSCTTKRPIKRLRTSVGLQTYLPSPASSAVEVGADAPSGGLLLGLPSLHHIQSMANEGLPTRKRRLSDADAIELPKYPHNSMIASCHHIVSDPLPGASPCSNTENDFSFDDWLNTDFGPLFAIPPPVGAAEVNSSAPWEVDLFRDYNIPGNLQNVPTISAAETRIPAMGDLTELDNLLQSAVNDTFATTLESAPPPGTIGTSYMPPFDSSIPNISHIDWTSLEGPDTYQSTIDSTFSHYPTDFQSLPGIDPAMMQLPPVSFTSQNHDDFASKQARLDQLHAMQEAVRRMEQELQSEGVII